MIHTGMKKLAQEKQLQTSQRAVTANQARAQHRWEMSGFAQQQKAHWSQVYSRNGRQIDKQTTKYSSQSHLPSSIPADSTSTILLWNFYQMYFRQPCMAFPSLHGQGHKVRKQAKIRAPRALAHPSNGLRGEELLELLELVSCFLASLAGTSSSSTAQVPTWALRRSAPPPQTPSLGTRHGSQLAGEPPRQGAGLGHERSDEAPAAERHGVQGDTHLGFVLSKSRWCWWSRAWDPAALCDRPPVLLLH